jgi:MFS family permease
LTAVAGAVGHHVCSYLLRRFRVSPVIVGAAAVTAVGAALYALGTGPWPMAVAATCLGIGSGVAATAAYASGGTVIPHAARGVGFGMLTGAALVGLAASPVVAGLLGAATLRGVFLVDVLLMMALAVGVRRWMTVGQVS